MASYLDVEGTYEPGKRFSFTNISDKLFESKWNGIPIRVDSGETIELSDATPFPGAGMGHCLAVKLTKELTDQIILGMAKTDEEKKGMPFYRSPLGTQVAVPEARRPYEEKILKELEEDELLIKALQRQKGEEISSNFKRQEGVSYEATEKEFADVTNNKSEVKPPRKAVKTKKII